MFLIINAGNGQVHITSSNQFYGILWIAGDVFTTGNGFKVTGSLFVQKNGSDGGAGNFNGTADFTHSLSLIDKVYHSVNLPGPGTPGKPVALTWREI
jgi:hypothetical protein